MQPQLTRSSTEVMLTGVCGGLGEYFHIDPVIVRAIFVLVTLTSGLGIPVYIVLAILMPKSAPATPPYQAPFPSDPQSHEAARLGQNFDYSDSLFGGQSQEVRVAQRPGSAAARSGPGQAVPQPGEYRFDPLTGQPLRPDAPATGETVNLTLGMPELPSVPGATPSPDQQAQGLPYEVPRRGRNWRTLGFILVGIGALVLLEQVVGNLSFLFPIMLIIAGIILLMRRR